MWKKREDSDIINHLRTVYNFSHRKAVEIVKTLSKKQLKILDEEIVDFKNRKES